jgi:MFS family permease
MPVPEAGIAVGTAVLIAGPLGHLSGGYLTDRFQRARVEGAAGMVMFIGLLTAIPFGLGFTLVTDFWWSILAFGGLTYFLTMAAPASLAGLQMLTPDRLRGLVTSIFLCVVTLIGVGLGPPLIGFITDHFFEHERFLGHSLALVMLFFAPAGAIAAWASRRPVARTVAIVSADY